MLINEVCKEAELTKKAIEYYIEQDLIHPVVLENGYREFSQDDLVRLKKVSMYRRLGLSVFDIKAVLSDETGESLQKIAIQKELNSKREQMRKSTLDKLCRGLSKSEISADLAAIEISMTIAEKLLYAFPGYFGRFVCLHFARFLNEPLTTNDEKAAYNEMLTFLDNAPNLEFPEEVQSFLDEYTAAYSPEVISTIIDNAKKAVENPDAFISENNEVLEQYLSFKQSEEYKKSPANTLSILLKEFCETSGYYDVFIPAMKKLSKSYAQYSRQMINAEEKFLAHFPEINSISSEQ